MNKIFIIGLPRTGTTSVCVALLELGYRVAHTAYTQQAFTLADAVADTPVFCDYRQLHQLFPGSKFIYLQRSLADWLPSIKVLLQKLMVKIDPLEGGYQPLIKRCYQQTFEPLTCDSITDDAHLRDCYLRHRAGVLDYFAQRSEDLLSIDVARAGELQRLCEFLGSSLDAGEEGGGERAGERAGADFPHLNTGGRIAAWDKIKHPGKVSANASGPLRRRFFDYPELAGDADGEGRGTSEPG